MNNDAMLVAEVIIRKYITAEGSYFDVQTGPGDDDIDVDYALGILEYGKAMLLSDRFAFEGDDD